MPTSDPHPSLFRRHQVAFKAGPGPAVPTSRHGAGVTSLPPPPRHGEAVTGSFPPHTGARACTHMPTHMPTRAYRRTHTHTCAHTRVQAHTRTHMHTRMHIHVHTCPPCTHMDTWTRIHVHAFTHPLLSSGHFASHSPSHAGISYSSSCDGPFMCVSPPPRHELARRGHVIVVAEVPSTGPAGEAG